MTLPDQRHINQVCEALWRRPGAGASVMVGSGFSRNARTVRPGSDPLPLLDDIARALWEKLYPDRGTNQDVPPERVTRLAQAYEAEFKPTGLHNALRTLVADDDFTPSSAHERLLRLPWADVFTTNWDTLLESASKTVLDRAYTIVRNMNDIPKGARPRIIKLHGSLPDSSLILTEEDYRTYPHRFSAFVNTVQQAMMETTFLLVGFSGNDPNFLHWSGWVRDILGTAALPIYLAGFLDLSNPDRRMLHERNVVPIDLARHPQANEWSDVHKYATKWILSTLECGQPYDISKWPTPRAEAFCPEDNPALQPIIRNVSAEPRKESLGPPKDVAPETRLATTKATLAIWKHNRLCYPGWVVAPGRVRAEVWYSTERWAPFIFPELPELAVLERLAAIREIIWRYELTLDRIPDELHAAAEAVLGSIDCTGRTVAGSRPNDVDWGVTRVAWREVALALLTVARYGLDAAAFDKQLNRIEPLLGDDGEAAHRVNHERCLWALWALDHATIGERLDAWRTDEGDPAWAMRKSALLREIGRKEEANRLIMRALDRIRAIPDDPIDLGGPSREGWALWSLIETFPFDASFQTRWDNVQARWDELAVVKCNPPPDVRNLNDELSTAQREAWVPAFDLGMRPTETHTVQMVLPPSACRGIRLTEVAGLASLTGVRTDASGLVKRAAEALMSDDAVLGMHQMIRVARSDSDKALMRVLTRPQVASLTRASANAMASDVQIALKYAVSCIRTTEGERRRHHVDRASVAIESLSRLVLRLDAPSVLSVFDLALDIYRDTAVMAWVFLHKSIHNLLRRCWESFDEEQRTDRVLDVLEMPIVGLDGFASAGDQWPDPGEILSEDVTPPKRSMDNENRWEAVVATLIRGLESGGQARKRAAGRIADVVAWKRLTQPEIAKVAEALWEMVGNEGEGLPNGTSLPDYAFILLPEPAVGMGRSAFGRKWLTGEASQVTLTVLYGVNPSDGSLFSRRTPHKADDILYNTGLAVAFLRRQERSLALSSSELVFVTEVVERWIETNLRRREDVPYFFVEPARISLARAIMGLGWLLSDIRVSVSLARGLNRKVRELHDARLPEAGIPAFTILPGIVRSAPELLGDVELTMVQGLASNAESMARGAFRALHRWLLWELDENLSWPPSHLVREVGLAVAGRRPTAVGEALSVAQWIFEKGRMEHRDVIRDLVVSGMGYLLEELRYDRQSGNTTAVDIPHARWQCIRVARAIAAEDTDTPEIVRRWLEIGKDDPLPEVRHIAADWWRGGGDPE